MTDLIRERMVENQKEINECCEHYKNWVKFIKRADGFDLMLTIGDIHSELANIISFFECKLIGYHETMSGLKCLKWILHETKKDFMYYGNRSGDEFEDIENKIQLSIDTMEDKYGFELSRGRVARR